MAWLPASGVSRTQGGSGTAWSVLGLSSHTYLQVNGRDCKRECPARALWAIEAISARTACCQAGIRACCAMRSLKW